MSERGVGVRCRQCETDEPMNDKLGWIELRYEHLPDPVHRFCGSLCVRAWVNAALDRLVDRMVGRP